MKKYFFSLLIIAFIFSPLTIFLFFSASSHSDRNFHEYTGIKSNYLESVKKFGHVQIRARIPFGGPGDRTSYPLKVIPKSKFYVYVHRMGVPTACVLEECSFFDGSIVECMGGWLSGDQQPEMADRIGFPIEKVWKGKASIVVVADRNAKIIGIYPQHTEGDVVAILSQYPQYRDGVIKCMKIGVALDETVDNSQ